MKKTLFKFYRYIGKFVSGKGLRKLPLASKIYKFAYQSLKPKGVVEVFSEGHSFLIDSQDTGLGPPLIMHGIFAPVETEVLRRLLHPGMIFVDVGANIGYFSLIAAKEVTETGKVYAFEPDEENFALLSNNRDRNGYKNIIPVKKALSDSIGIDSFYLKKDNLCAHSLVPDRTSKIVEVETITFDEYFKDIQRIDVVKIDVEGAEPKVLHGMKKILSTQTKIALITEFFPGALQRCGVNPEDYLNELKSFGFTLYKMSEIKEEEPFSLITDEELSQLVRGVGIEKLINILCLKNWPINLKPFES